MIINFSGQTRTMPWLLMLWSIAYIYHHLYSVRYHDDVIKWNHFLCHWPFVRRIHRSPVKSPHKGQWRGALVFSVILAWTNGWINTRYAGDLRHHHVQYDVTVMIQDMCRNLWSVEWCVLYVDPIVFAIWDPIHYLHHIWVQSWTGNVLGKKSLNYPSIRLIHLTDACVVNDDDNTLIISLLFQTDYSLQHFESLFHWHLY